MRTIGAVASAIAVPVLVAILLAGIYAIELGDFPFSFFPVAEVCIVFALIVTVTSVLLLGIPMFAIFQVLKITSRNSYVFGGLSIGTLFALVVLLNEFYVLDGIDLFYHRPLLQFSLIIIGGLVSGPVSALVFWAVKRPGRSQNPV